MDETREEIPRISLDSFRQWHRIKANFTKAVLDQFDRRVRQSGLESDRAALLPHIQQVRMDFSIQGGIFLTRHCVSVYRHDF